MWKLVDPILACYLIFSMDATSCEEDYILPLVCILVKNNTYFRTLYQLYIFSHLFKFFHKWQECIATISPLQCRGREIDSEKFNLKLLFRIKAWIIKLKRRKGEGFWESASFAHCFWEGSIEIWHWNAKMGDIVQSYEPGHLLVHQPFLNRLFQPCFVQRTSDSLLHGW